MEIIEEAQLHLKELVKLKIIQLTTKGGKYFYWEAKTDQGEKELNSMKNFFNSENALDYWNEKEASELREFINQRCIDWYNKH